MKMVLLSELGSLREHHIYISAKNVFKIQTAARIALYFLS